VLLAWLSPAPLPHLTPTSTLNPPTPNNPQRPGPIAIIVSLVSAGLAAANLLLDFDFIRQASRSKSVPKNLEWYFSQSTLFTLVWMYVSTLQLLMQLAGLSNE